MKIVAHITSYKDTNKNLAINHLINHATSQNNRKPPNISHNHAKLPKTSQTHLQIPEGCGSGFGLEENCICKIVKLPLYPLHVMLEINLYLCCMFRLYFFCLLLTLLAVRKTIFHVYLSLLHWSYKEVNILVRV